MSVLFRKEVASRAGHVLILSAKALSIIYLKSQKRIEDLLYHSLEKRFLKLQETNGNIVQKLPQKYIASFIRITPQFLSRINNIEFRKAILSESLRKSQSLILNYN